MARKLIVLTGLLGLVALYAIQVTGPAAAADTERRPAKVATPPYVHTVIFTLKKDAPANEVEAIITDCHELLEKIGTVRHLWAGKPAEKATPKMAKKDYQVGLLVIFDDADGLQKYLDDPLHLKFLEKHGQFVDMEKLGVYDFVNQAK
jgi:hypothetical protein